MTRRRTSRRKPIASVLAVAAIALLAGCAKDAPQDTWQPKGDNAQKIHDLQWPVFLVAGIVGVIVMAAIGYAVVPLPRQGPADARADATASRRSRSRSPSSRRSSSSASASRPSARSSTSPTTDDTECIINVTGQQWWWEYDYPAPGAAAVASPEPIVTSGELVIPADTNVLLRLTSRDVIHSFWIPALNGKQRHRARAVCTPCACRPTSPASTPVSAPSSAASATPT